MTGEHVVAGGVTIAVVVADDQPSARVIGCSIDSEPDLTVSVSCAGDRGDPAARAVAAVGGSRWLSVLLSGRAHARRTAVMVLARGLNGR